MIPTGIVDTLWFQVQDQCSEWGDSFDTWQDGLGQLALGLRDDGLFAATVGGVTLSIPRQVAKTFIVGRIVFALCILFPNVTVLWTAHRTRTASQTFSKLKGLAQKPGVRRYMAAGGGIRSVNGEQEFSFANGSRIMFGAREQGFGRGFDEVDIEVFDEAQILTEKALEDMVAATNQSRFPHGALLFFMGTPPRPSDPGEEFTNRRTEALSYKALGVVVAEGEDSLYVECSADPKTGKPGGPAIDDQRQVEIANPSVPHRTPWISIKRLRKQLTSPDSWRREGLGIWDDTATAKLIMPNWPACAGGSEPEAPAALGVSVDLDRVWASLGASTGGDTQHVGCVLRVRLAQQRAMFVSEAARISTERGIPIALVAKGPAGTLEQELRDAGADVHTMTHDEYVTACADLFDAVESQAIEHGAYDDLDAAVAAATWGGVTRRVWSPKAGDVSALEAVTVAHWGATHAPSSIYENRGLVTL